MKRNLTAFFLIFAVVMGMSSSAGAFFQEDEERSDRRSVRTWSARAQRYLGPLSEAIEEDDVAEQKEIINSILNARGISNFDRAQATAFLGNLAVQDDNLVEALEKFKEAVAIEEGLNINEKNQLTFSIGSLNLATENFPEALTWYERWLRIEGVAPDASQHSAIASAYAQVEDFGQAEYHIDQALAKAESPNKSQHQTALYIYSELNRRSKKLPLLEKMVTLWPEERNFWLALRGEYVARGQDRKAFNVMQLAYKSGLLTREDEIRVLSQQYDVYGDPHHGAEILAREMRAGAVERDVDNLKLLGALYQNAREAEEALPVLNEAAGKADDGVINYQLAQTYASNEDWERTRDNARAALRKGGLSAAQRGQSYLLLGNALYQIGDRKAAVETFTEAKDIDHRRTVNESERWIEYIMAEADAERRRLRQIWQFEREEIEGEIQRCKQLRETLEIFGAGSGEVDEEELRKCDTAEERLKAHLADRPYENVELSTPEGEGAQSGR